MFTYFKKKEEEQSEHKKPNALTQQNSKQVKSNQSDQSIKLPSDIFAQLLNQSSSTSEQKVQVSKTQENASLRKQSEGEGKPKLSQDGVETRQKQNHISEGNLGDKNIRTEIPKGEQKIQKIPQPKSQNRSPKLLPSHNINFIPPTNSQKGKHLSSLSQQQINDLFSMFLDVLIKSVESQIIGESLSTETLSSQILPSTVQTIRKLNSNFYQNFLLETKEKYNQLVDQSTNLFLKSRQIANLVNQFVLSINLFFESQELLIPAQQIQKAIAELNPQKTEKYINYLIKIFESNFDDVIQKRVKNMKTSLESQLRKSQKQIKQLETELKKVSSQFKQKQNIFTEQQNKFSQKQSLIQSLKRQISDLNIKLANISSSSKQTRQDYNSQLSLLKRQLQRSKKQTEQLSEKTKKLQKMIEKKDKLLAQKEEEVEKLGDVIKKVKEVENQGMQNIVEEMEMNEKLFQTKIEKFNTQKIQLQHKIRTLMTDRESHEGKIKEMEAQLLKLKEQIEKLNSQIIRLNQQNSNKKQLNQRQSEDTQKHSKGQNQQEEQEEQKVDLSNLVNKQIFKHLFLSFDDQSKQWAVRNNIRNQIYIMLDVKKGGNNAVDQQPKPTPIKLPNPQPNQAHLPAEKESKKSAEGSLIGKWLGW